MKLIRFRKFEKIYEHLLEAKEIDLAKERESQRAIKDDINAMKEEMVEIDRGDDTPLEKAKMKRNIMRDKADRLGDLSRSIELEADLMVDVEEEKQQEREGEREEEEERREREE